MCYESLNWGGQVCIPIIYLLKVLSKFFYENFLILKNVFINYLLLKVDDNETSDKIIKSISGPLTALFKFKFVKNECQFFVQVIGQNKVSRTPFLCHVTNITILQFYI